MYEFEKIAGVKPSVNYSKNPKYKFEKLAYAPLGSGGSMFRPMAPNNPVNMLPNTNAESVPVQGPTMPQPEENPKYMSPAPFVRVSSPFNRIGIKQDPVMRLGRYLSTPSPIVAKALPQLESMTSHNNFVNGGISNNNSKDSVNLNGKLNVYDQGLDSRYSDKNTAMYDTSEANLARQSNRQDSDYGWVIPGTPVWWNLQAQDTGIPLGNYNNDVINEYRDQHWADKYLQQQAAEENYRRQAQAQADRHDAEKAVAKYDKNLTADQWMAMNPLQRGNVINQYNRDQYAVRNKKMQEDTTWADMDKGIDPMTGKFVNLQAEEGYNNAVNNYNDIRQRYINKERSLWENRWRANGKSDSDIDKYLNSEADKYMANHGLTDPRKAVYERYKDNLNYTPSSPFAEGAWKQPSTPATPPDVKSPKAPPAAKAPATLAPRYTRPSAPAVPSSPSLEPSMPGGVIGDAFTAELPSFPAESSTIDPMPPLEDPFL